MAKVIMFSQVFPTYHKRAGEPTKFVAKFVWGLEYFRARNTPKEVAMLTWNTDWTKISPKYHTIRKGNRFKAGDKFSPRVWSDKPYRSKQIILAPDVEIKKVWKIEMTFDEIYIDGMPILGTKTMEELAKNDGLTLNDFFSWFSGNDFTGQIICWSNEVNY